MNEKDNQELDRAVKSTIVVHDLIGIFVHAAAVCRWPAGSVRLIQKVFSDASSPDGAP